MRHSDQFESWSTYRDDHLAVISSLEFLKIGEQIENAAHQVVNVLQGGGRLLVTGNGGSASDANHIVGELVGTFLSHRKGLDVISLAANSTVLTAWGNDFEFDTVFARQVEAHLKPGDVLLLLSTSGESKNILTAAQTALDMGGIVIGLTGQGPNSLSECAHISICIPSTTTSIIQEGHAVCYHYMCSVIERNTTVHSPLT